MYAVIVTGGKQYRVSQGDKVRVEKLDAAEGDSVELDKVLMIVDGDDIKIGAPAIEGGKVTAEVKTHGRSDKVNIIKFRFLVNKTYQITNYSDDIFYGQHLILKVDIQI